MAARGIRDMRMGHMGTGLRQPGRPIQVAHPPTIGKPVISRRPMVPPVQPALLQGPNLGSHPAPISVPSGMPAPLQGPQQVNPAGPENIQPIAASAPRM